MSKMSSNKKRKESGIKLEDTAGEDDFETLYLETKKKLEKTEHDLENTKKELERALAKAGDVDEDDGEVTDSEDSIDGSDTWTQMFKELREYRAVHGSFKVDKNANKKLCKWVAYQRFTYMNLKVGKNKQKISPDRVDKLESIGFTWGGKYPTPPTWEERYQELLKHKKTMGHCKVRINPSNPSPLAKWIMAQRIEYKRMNNGKDSLITPEQIQQLREIGFKWKSS